ncbi:helix-turn-helix domain-containing protein [Dactylosporangium darangshiense]|uniref:helix-turn-helix domain-containing protein n=1 Tax=Dactylosporangium darangshiense TaxID=579108 RepID=UPI00363FCDE1
MGVEQGLRERKKRETRRLISDVATMLFVERGFDAVTVAEIAARAGVAPKTVFNYFPRKEDLFLDRLEELSAMVTAAVRGAARASARPTRCLRWCWTCWRSGTRSAATPSRATSTSGRSSSTRRRCRRACASTCRSSRTCWRP